MVGNRDLRFITYLFITVTGSLFLGDSNPK